MCARQRNEKKSKRVFQSTLIPIEFIVALFCDLSNNKIEWCGPLDVRFHFGFHRLECKTHHDIITTLFFLLTIRPFLKPTETCKEIEKKREIR